MLQQALVLLAIVGGGLVATLLVLVQVGYQQENGKLYDFAVKVATWFSFMDRFRSAPPNENGGGWR